MNDDLNNPVSFCEVCGIKHRPLKMWSRDPYECVPKVFRDHGESLFDGLEDGTDPVELARHVYDFAMDNLGDIVREALRLEPETSTELKDILSKWENSAT